MTHLKSYEQRSKKTFIWLNLNIFGSVENHLSNITYVKECHCQLLVKIEEFILLDIRFVECIDCRQICQFKKINANNCESQQSSRISIFLF